MAPLFTGLKLGGFGKNPDVLSTSVSTLGTLSNPAVSASQILAANPTAPDGIYYFRIPGGSNTVFQTYCIMQRYGGGWMKAVQYNNNTDVVTSSAVNAGGSWINSEINTNQAGKLATSDINANMGSSFLLRVTGGSDNLLNSGAGTARLTYSTTLPNWGTDLDPTGTYSWFLDNASDGVFEYQVQYTNDGQARCNHVTNYWINDHNYNATLISSPPPYGSYAICWTFGSNTLVTNLHWMSGQASQSGGNVYWGNASNTSAAIFVKN